MTFASFSHSFCFCMQCFPFQFTPPPPRTAMLSLLRSLFGVLVNTTQNALYFL
jgi:hypothetical protein